MRLTEVRAIVFDVDGTLYPQLPVRARMAFELAKRFGSNPAAAFRTTKVLRAYRTAHERVRADGGGSSASELQLRMAIDISGEKPEFVRQSVREWFQQRPLRHLKKSLYPDVVNFLWTAKRRGIHLGVVSDYPATEKLEAMGIAGYFDAVISSHDKNIGVLKPHPGALQACLRQLATPPDKSVYVGDRVDVDFPCAKNAGTHFVLFGRAPVNSGCLGVFSYKQLSKALGLESQD